MIVKLLVGALCVGFVIWALRRMAARIAEMLPPPEDVAAPPEDAEAHPSGLFSRVLEPGEGDAQPTPQSEVTVHYTGWQTSGAMFDSSVLRGRPARFPLGHVIEGWRVGVPLMRVGEKRRFWIPAELAYGNGRGGPSGMLVFDVELLAIHDA